MTVVCRAALGGRRFPAGLPSGCQLVARDTSAVTGHSDPTDKELVAGKPGFWVLGQRGERHLESRRVPTVESEYNKVCDPRLSWFVFCVISAPSGRSVRARPDPPPFHITKR